MLLSNLNLEQYPCVSLLSAWIQGEQLYPAGFYMLLFLLAWYYKCLPFFQKFHYFLVCLFNYLFIYSFIHSSQLSAFSPTKALWSLSIFLVFLESRQQAQLENDYLEASLTLAGIHSPHHSVPAYTKCDSKPPPFLTKQGSLTTRFYAETFCHS